MRAIPKRRHRAGLVTIVLGVALLPGTGCSRTTSHVGLLAPRQGLVGLKLLRPGVSRRVCAASWLGLGGDAVSVDTVVAELLALDDEAQLLADADVRWDVVVTGVYNRRCVEVRGDLSRPAATMLLPAPAGGHRHH